MAHFNLHPQLEADTWPISDMVLNKLLLMNDSNFPWLIMVPKVGETREIHELTPGDRQQLMDEVSTVSSMLQRLTHADKMNVAALGNMVPQLHLHVIARFQGDAAWPGPIWGKVPGVPYETAAAETLIKQIRRALAL